MWKRKDVRSDDVRREYSRKWEWKRSRVLFSQIASYRNNCGAVLVRSYCSSYSRVGRTEKQARLGATGAPGQAHEKSEMQESVRCRVVWGSHQSHNHHFRNSRYLQDVASAKATSVRSTEVRI